MLQIILGLLLVVIGAFITIKANTMYSILGPVSWAEAHLLTAGGSRFFYKLIGITLAIVGFLIMTGLIQDIVFAIFIKLFGRPTSPSQL